MTSMSDQELDSFLAQCCERLEQRQTYLVEEFGIGQCDRFDLDLEAGILTGHDAIGICFRAEITPIGSYSRRRRQWSWAWANPDLAPQLQQRARCLRALADQTGLKLFQADGFESDEPLVLELTAMACQQLQAVGCYQVEPRGNQENCDGEKGEAGDLLALDGANHAQDVSPDSGPSDRWLGSNSDTYLMLALTALCP